MRGSRPSQTPNASNARTAPRSGRKASHGQVGRPARSKWFCQRRGNNRLPQDGNMVGMNIMLHPALQLVTISLRRYAPTSRYGIIEVCISTFCLLASTAKSDHAMITSNAIKRPSPRPHLDLDGTLESLALLLRPGNSLGTHDTTTPVPLGLLVLL
jgi:hypothetical protein